ncbi:MAG: asparaginase domain-containing protein [Bacteroidota bacterium]
MHILFIQTGGTIDKDYPKSLGGYAFEFGEPAVQRILTRLDPSFSYDIITAFQKDSQEILASDREKILGIIQENSQKRIIITHGTDTLLETASFLGDKFENRIIVLTGAMRPERFSNSDASVNLGMALSAVQLIDSGVYVCMHGILKSHREIKRDLQNGKFY